MSVMQVADQVRGKQRNRMSVLETVMGSLATLTRGCSAVRPSRVWRRQWRSTRRSPRSEAHRGIGPGASLYAQVGEPLQANMREYRKAVGGFGGSMQTCVVHRLREELIACRRDATVILLTRWTSS